MKLLYTLALGAAVSTALPAWAAGPTSPHDKHAFISNLLARMTLEEKIGQLRLISIGPEMTHSRIQDEIAAGRIGGTFNTVTPSENRPLQEAAVKRSRLGIPIYFAYDVVHGHRTIFPIGLGLASSWDMNAIQRAARVAAREASADGLDMTFAPTVDIARDPRWGRTSEGFGEDPHLVSEIARFTVHGFQDGTPNRQGTVMAAVKHFAMYGAVQGGRDYNVVDMSPMRMYNEYLPPYRAAIEAGAGGVMVALNSVNGVPASSNTWLLRDLLRTDWGFSGVTLSDHGAIDELTRHGVAADGREAAQLAVNAGVDMSMADALYRDELPGLVKSGAVNISTLDDAVREVLGAKYDMGLFADPFVRIGKAENDPADVHADSRLHRADARDIARRSLVLLENHNDTLPLKKAGTIAVVGPLAHSKVDMLGSWSAAGKAAQTVTLLEGVTAAVGGHARVIHARGANIIDDQRIIDYLNFLNWDEKEVVSDPRSPQVLIDEAVAAAREADVVVAAVGESRGMSHESSSRTSLDIPESQRALLKALKETGKPLVLVLMNGRPLSLNWEKENASAMLETWYSGTEGGHAIADVLFGDYNPSGKLPITFPRSVGQVPTYYGAPRVGRPFVEGKPGNYTSQYYEETTGPLYPFGYGLSYTEFAVSDVALSGSTMTPQGRIQAAVNVKNMGDVAGETVVQLYVHDVSASVVRPIKELKDFRKVSLAPGEQKLVQFDIDANMLKFYNAKLEHVAEPGAFKVQIGLDSTTTNEAGFTLQ